MTTDNPGITKGCPLTVELEGTSCQFVLYVNAYGEIVHLENHFLALPAEAQQLIAGSAAGRIAEKLKSYELLLRYLTPIAALGYMEEEQWKAIYRETTTLNHKLSEQPDNQQPLPNAWTRQIRQLHQDPEKQGVLSLAAEFIHINTQGFSEFLLHRIGETKEMIFEPLLHVVLNVLDSESLILLCYQDIGHYQTENSRLLLTTHLVDKHYARYRNRILTALGNYQDDAIRAFLLKFYHEKRQIEGIDWEPWIIALKPYNGPEVNAAFLDLMTGINSNSALEAFAALHTNGYSEVDLLPHLLRVIREKRSKRHVKCALNTLDQIEDTALLPTADELISIFIWDCESIADDQQDLGQNIRELLTRRKNENAFTRLYPYLRHSDPEIRERTLELLAIGEAADFREIVRLLEDDVPAVRQKALAIVRDAAQQKTLPEAVAPLMAIWKIEQSWLHIKIMVTLMYVLENAPDEQALPFLLSQVDHDHHLVRFAVVRGLRHFRSPQVIEAVTLLRNDKNSHVRKAAEEAYNSF